MTAARSIILVVAVTLAVDNVLAARRRLGPSLEDELASRYVDRGAVQSATTSIWDTSVYYLIAGPSSARCSVLLLHGAAFTARTWQVLGLLDALSAAGCRVMAVDIPGFSGKSDAKKLNSAQREGFVHELLTSTGWIDRRILVVAASMGGSYAVPFVFGHPELCSGYVSIAAMIEPSSSPAKLPALIIWGQLDNPGKAAVMLAADPSLSNSLCSPPLPYLTP